MPLAEPAGRPSGRHGGGRKRGLPAVPRIELLAPPDPILTGLQRFAARVDSASLPGGSGASVDRVTFLLDGRPLLTKTRPPYEVELDLGDEARVRTVAVEAWGDDGDEPLARDQRVLNTGSDPFTLHLLATADAAGRAAPLTAHAVLELPAGRRVTSLDYYLGERRVARLDAPPFERAVELPRPRATTALRAVATLEDGRRAEDTVLVNARDVADRVDVHMVELYTSAVDQRGREVGGLGPDDFEVHEDGVPQTLLRCEKVDDLPVHASLVLDVSASMTYRMPTLAKAAAAFLTDTFTPRDRANVVVFDRHPRVVVPFTADLPRLANALVGLRAGGGTALNDGLIFALREMQGIGGQRVLLLFSDGDDRLSTVATRQVLEYARRAGVTIHTVGIAIPPEHYQPRNLLADLATETGGLSFFVEDLGGIDQVYAEIGRAMRSSYLLAYQSSHGTGGGFRTVEVAVARPGTEAHTIRGYYP